MRNRQARAILWGVIRRLKKFDISLLASQAELEYGTAHRYVKELARYSYLKRVRRRQGKHDADIYELASDPGAIAPLVGGKADGMDHTWQAMRQLREFSSPQIQAVTGLEVKTVNQYLLKFRRTGYIQIVRERISG
jgi:Fic family protein